MSEQERARLFLMGEAGSGKSTWLAALLGGLESEAVRCFEEVGAGASNKRLHRALLDRLHEGKYPERTAETGPLEIELASTIKGLPGHFVVEAVDSPGELVRREFEARVQLGPWHREARLPHVVVMVRARGERPPRLEREGEWTLAEQWERLRELRVRGDVAARPARSRGGLSPEMIAPGVASDVRISPEPGDPVVVLAEEVVLIEALQLLRRAGGLEAGQRPPKGSARVAVMIASWDGVGDGWERRGPRAWLRERAALLDDFLACSYHAADVEVFGLSSTGGDLRDPAHQKAYLKEPGGYVVREDVSGRPVKTSDVGLPLGWLLLGDRALQVERDGEDGG
jgi:hypothetical protein